MKKNNRKNSVYFADLYKYLSKTAQAQILIKNKDFRKKILTIRRKWKIPLQGFKNKKACQKWLEFPPEKILRYRKTVQQIEKQIIHIDRDTTIETEATPKIIKGLMLSKNISKFPIGSLVTDIEIFMTQNNIDYALFQPLLSYIYYDKILKSSYPKTIIEASERVIYTKSKAKVRHSISLEIGPNTRQKDILKLWDKLISPLQIRLPGYLSSKNRKR